MTPAPQRKLPVDPAWIALAVAALVLVATSAWLASTRPTPERRVEAAPAVAAQPATPAPSPMETLIASLTARVAASETALAELRARPAGDPAAVATLRQQIEQGRAAAAQSLDGRVKAIEDGLTQRIAEGNAAIGRRLDALEQSLAQRTTADQAIARRLEAIERSAADRANGEQAQTRRLESLERSAAERAAGELSIGRRVEAMDQAATQRAAQAELTLNQRLAAIEQSVAPLQDALRRLGATEARTERLSTINALRSLLDAGQPLGSALPRLGGTPPEALARYVTAAPPTEAALRLSFEEAVRQARMAATTTQESLTSRLNSLLTVRRGDEVIWGDTSEVQIERARRALEAGDVEGAVAALARLPETNRAALRGWIADAEALVAARTALRSLAAG